MQTAPGFIWAGRNTVLPCVPWAHLWQCEHAVIKRKKKLKICIFHPTDLHLWIISIYPSFSHTTGENQEREIPLCHGKGKPKGQRGWPRHQCGVNHKAHSWNGIPRRTDLNAASHPSSKAARKGITPGILSVHKHEWLPRTNRAAKTSTFITWKKHVSACNPNERRN